MSNATAGGTELIARPEAILEQVQAGNRQAKVYRAILRLIAEAAETGIVVQGMPNRGETQFQLDEVEKKVRLLNRLHRLSQKHYYPDAGDDEDVEDAE